MYRCGCGKKWMNQIGGLQKCHVCHRQTQPDDGHQSVYSCDCGNSWPSFSAGWKICNRCGKRIHSQSGEDAKKNNNEQRKDEDERMNFREKARLLEEEERRLDVEKRKFYAERRHFEVWKMKQEQEYKAKMLENEKKELQKQKREFKEEMRATERAGQSEERDAESPEDVVRREEKLQQDERNQFEKNKREHECWKRRMNAAGELFEGETTYIREESETGEELCQNETEVDASEQNEERPETEETSRGLAEDVEEQRAWNKAMEKNEEGNEYFEEGHYEKAIVDFTAAIELLQTDATFYDNRSAVFIKLNRFQEALSDAKMAVDLDPACKNAQMSFIYCLLKLGQGMLAERACNDMLKQYPDDPGILKSYLKEARDIYTMTEEIDGDIQRSSYNRALKTLEEVVGKCPGCSDFQLKKAEVLVRLRRYKEAEDCLSELKRENDPGVFYVLGLSFYNQDHLTKAMENYRRALVYLPGDAIIVKAYKMTKMLDDLRRRADAHRVMREYQKAVDKYTEALAVDPSNHVTRSRLLYHKGLSCSLMNEFDKAIGELTRAIEHDETFARSYAVRASCYMKTKNYRAAMEDFELAYGLDTLPETKRLLEDATKKFEEEEERANPKNCFAAFGTEENTTEADSVRTNQSHHTDGDYCDEGTDMMDLD